MTQKIIKEFLFLTFCIAFLVSGILIVSGEFGFRVHSYVQTLPELLMNIPFSLYILSPAITAYIVLRKHHKITTIKQWLSIVFYAKNNIFPYIFVIVMLGIYFLIHIVTSGVSETAQPWLMFFLSLPGNLIIGGFEEAGWMSILQPEFDKRYGYVKSSFYVGLIWLAWHIPLFFIPGTNHGDGVIDFGMFAVQILAFRFFYGAIYKISGKSGVFMCILTHTMFNAASYTFGIPPTTWMGTFIANSVIIILSLIVVAIYNQKNGRKPMEEL